MKEYLRTVYHCSYCSEYYINKGNATRHEKYCKNNPANTHACFNFCQHLKLEKINEGSGVYKVFTCKCTGQEMYSFKAEKSIIKRFPEQFEHAIRMPLECDKFSPDLGYMGDY